MLEADLATDASSLEPKAMCRPTLLPLGSETPAKTWGFSQPPSDGLGLVGAASRPGISYAQAADVPMTAP